MQFSIGRYFVFAWKKLLFIALSLLFLGKKPRCRKCSFFYKGFEVPNSKRTYHVKIQVFLCMNISAIPVWR